jgi:hypothetical protein
MSSQLITLLDIKPDVIPVEEWIIYWLAYNLVKLIRK